MKVGILNAIHPAQSKIDWGGSPVDAYIRFLREGYSQIRATGFGVAQGEFPQTPDDFDAFLITGSPKGAYDSDPWIAELQDFIRDSFSRGQKILGICFGHQVIAHALGGRAEKSAKGWGLGQKSISISKKKSWMIDSKDQVDLYFVHQDQVTYLPPGAEQLGGNEFVPNAMFNIYNQVLGVQGHPEFSLDIMKQAVGDFEGKISPDLYMTAWQSINQNAPDNQLLGRWITSFMREGIS